MSLLYALVSRLESPGLRDGGGSSRLCGVRAHGCVQRLVNGREIRSRRRESSASRDARVAPVAPAAASWHGGCQPLRLRNGRGALLGAAAAKNNKGCGVCPPQQVQSPRWREDSWPRAREASPKRAGAGRPAAGATGSPRSSPRKGLPWSTAAPRGERGKPGKWPGRRSSAARAGGLVGPVNRRCSSRGAFAQHGSQVPAVPPQGVKCRTRCMQSTNPPSSWAALP